MAKEKQVSSLREKKNITRKGIHSKKKHSNHKRSKLYKKLSVGQG